MITRILPLIVLVLAGCNIDSRDSATRGAAPAVQTPVGPIPGTVQKASLIENPYANDHLVLPDGRRLFVDYNCSGCHGGHAGGGMGPSLRDKSWIYGNADARIFSSIAEGRANGMPAWGTRVPVDQIWRLVAYIKSLRTPAEPEAPDHR